MYLQIVPVKLRNGHETVITNALLDSGADSTLIREDTAEQLDVHSTTSNVQISNTLLRLLSLVASLEISSSNHPNGIK